MGIFSLFKSRDSAPKVLLEDSAIFHANMAKQKKRELLEQRQELQMKTEELRALKEQVKLDLEIQKLQQELEDLRAEDEPLDEVKTQMNPEDAMMMTLMQKVLNNNPQPVQNTQPPPTSNDISTEQKAAAGHSISDEQIKNYLARVPRRNMATLKKLTNDELKTQVLNVIPQADEVTINKVMAQIRVYPSA